MLTSVLGRGDRARYTRGELYSYSGQDRRVKDGKALESIGFGLGLMDGLTYQTYTLPLMNSYVGVLSADMVSGGIATLSGKIVSPDGTETAIALTATDGTFETDQLTTATNIKDYLEGLDDDVTVTLSNSNRTFTMTVAGDKRFVITAGFTRSGSGTATFTNTKGTTKTIAAISERSRISTVQISLANEDQTPVYVSNASVKQWVPGLVAGDPAVPVFGDITVGATPLCLLEDYTDSDSVLNPRGSFRADNDSGNAPVVAMTGDRFSGPKNNGLAPISLFRV